MKPFRFILFLLFTTQLLFAQKTPVNEYAAIDKKALQLPDSLTKTTDQIASYFASNFTTDKDKSRAIFVWVASNIQYDIENMFAINFYENIPAGIYFVKLFDGEKSYNRKIIAQHD